MRIVTGTEGGSSLVCTTNDEIELLKAKIGILEFLYDAEGPSLSEAERTFLAHCIDLQRKGTKMGSTKARDYLMEVMNIGMTRVYDLRKYLKNKGWLAQSMNGYSYPEILDGDLVVSLTNGDEDTGTENIGGREQILRD